MKRKLFSLLVLLMTAVTGAMAQVTFTCTVGTNFDGGEGMAKMFDGNTDTKFLGETGSDVYAIVTASEPVYVWGYDWTTADDNESQGRLPKRWTLCGTNDQTVASNPSSDAWVTLSDLGQNDWIQQKNFFTQRFFCDKGTAETAYKYFKITLTEGGSVQMSEFTFLYETAPVVDYNWSSSSQDGAKNACDLRPNTKWEGNNLAGNWLIVESSDGQAHSLKQYSFTTNDDGDWNNRAPKEWLIEGSNDKSTWVTVDEVTGGDPIDNVNYTTFSFTPANTTDVFRYYRLTLTTMKSTGWNQLAEFHVVAGPAILSYSLTLKEVTVDADKWTIDPNPAQVGNEVTVTYSGLMKVKSVKAVKEELLPVPYAIVNFSFTDGTNPINVSSLTISSEGGKLGSFQKVPGTYYSNFNVIEGQNQEGDEGYGKLVDGDTGSKWCQNGGPWSITFNADDAITVDGYTLYTGNDTQSSSGRNPKNWVLKGKLNEDDNWTVIAQVTNDNTMPAANTTPVDFVADNPGSYKYFQFEVLDTRGDGIMQLAELKLWTAGEETVFVYGPTVTYTADEPASEMTVNLYNKREGADTYTLTAVADGWKYFCQLTDKYFKKGKIYNVPVELVYDYSNVTVLGGQQGESSGDENYYKLFDGNKSSKWCSYKGWAGTYDERVNNHQNGVKDQVIWKTPSPILLGGYVLTTGNDTQGNPGRNWKNWTLYGANFAKDADATIDAEGWTVIQQIVDDNVLQAVNCEDFTFEIPGNNTYYQYYRLVIDDIQDTGDNVQQMSEITLVMTDIAPASNQVKVAGVTLNKAKSRSRAAMDEEASFTEGVFLTSTDGRTWTLAQMPAFDLELEVEYYTGAEVDQMAADDVIALINAIGEVAYTNECKALIDAAREAYDALTDDQKALVTNYETLTAAETRYAELAEISTGISTAKAAADKDVWYDMNGRKLQGKPTVKGVYMKNNMKVVVK